MRRSAVVSLILIAALVLCMAAVTRSYRLHWAARRGDIAEVERLLANGADPNRAVFRGPPDRIGSTPLAYAIEGGHPEVVRRLLEHGARIPAVGVQPMLRYVIRKPEITAALLEYGADPNAILDGDTPLLLYAIRFGHPDTVSELLRHGADANVRCSAGCTSLHDALIRTPEVRAELVALLLLHGVDPNARVDHLNRATGLMLAARVGDSAIVSDLLAAGGDPLLRDEKGWTAIEWARDREGPGQSEVLRLLEAGHR